MKNLRYFVFIYLVGVLLGRAQSASEIEWKSWSELEHSIKKNQSLFSSSFMQNGVLIVKKLKEKYLQKLRS